MKPPKYTTICAIIIILLNLWMLVMDSEPYNVKTSFYYVPLDILLIIVTMPMVNVGVVFMAMKYRMVHMPVSVGTDWIGIIIMRMGMMFVVGMLVRMFSRVVHVFMVVVLGKVQPNTRPHQSCSNQQ